MIVYLLLGGIHRKNFALLVSKASVATIFLYLVFIHTLLCSRPYGIGVATGEMCANRVMFKQFLQSGGMQFCQIDSARIGSVNEIMSVYLMAEKLNGEWL